MTAGSKLELMDKITNYHNLSWTCGMYKNVKINALRKIFGNKDNYVRVFNLHKHNRKTEHYVEHGVKRTRVKSPMFWEAFVYDIPLDVLTVTNLSVFQENRHFRLVNRECKQI